MTALRWLLLIAFIAAPIIALSQPAEPGKDEYLYAHRLFDEGYYDLAAAQLERFLRDYPTSVDVIEAQFLLGEAYQKTGDLEKARSAFLRLALVYPDAPRAPESLMRVGQILSQLNRPLDAAQAYQRVQGFYPQDRFAPEGLHLAVELFLVGGDTARAEATAEALITQYPTSEASNLARLDAALIRRKRGDLTGAKSLCERIIERSGVDSIVAQAHLETARLLRREYRLDASSESYLKAIAKFAIPAKADAARIELADLLNVRGLTSDAIKTVESILKNPGNPRQAEAQMKTGDADYLEAKYSLALQFYDQAAAVIPDAALKGAWTSERVETPDKSLRRYLTYLKRSGARSPEAESRAALIAMRMDRPDLAVELWSRAIKDSLLKDAQGRTWLELGRAILDAETSGVAEIADQLLTRLPDSPYADDLYFLSIRSASCAGDYNAAQKRADYLVKRFPASPLADSALTLMDFIRRDRKQSNRLMELMARLSSRPLGSVSPVRWSIDWGDFYLDEFKDPVKAVDQYDLALDDILATTHDRIHALHRSGDAYVRLAEISLDEGDEFGAVMFSDSARSRLQQLQKFAPDSMITRALWEDVLKLDIACAENDSARSVILKRIRVAFKKTNSAKFKPATIISYLNLELNLQRVDSSNANELIKFTALVHPDSVDARTAARFKWLEAKIWATAGKKEPARQAALLTTAKYPETSAGGEAAWWLIEDQGVSPSDRLQRLRDFRKKYFYLVEPGYTFQLESELLDSLNRPLEALAAYEKAVTQANWGIPHLDILKTPDIEAFLKRGRAYLRAGKLDRARIEFRSLWNLDPKGAQAPEALLYLAKVYAALGDTSKAINYLDTLNLNAPYSKQADLGARIRPRLFMDRGEYPKAREGFQTLVKIETEPDSSFLYQTQAIVCLYRLNKLDEARDEAHELYKRFKDRNDLEAVKGLFYLEKGRSFDRSGNGEEARRQYKIVIDKFAFSEWADDAAFAIARSFINEKKTAEGLQAYQKCLENYPASPLKAQAWLELGLARYQAQQFSEATVALIKVWSDTTAEALWPRAYEGLIAVYRDMRYWDAAIRLTRSYLDRFLDAPNTLDRRMDIGQFYMQLGEWDEAVQYYRPLLPLADSEQEAEIQYYIAEAYHQKGDYRTAILEYLKVEVMGRKTKLDWGVTALYNAGLCYEKLNEPLGAARMYRRIIQETGAESNYGRSAQKRLDALPEGK
ncbi:MAG: tetratricopeptide repeat protein [Calditrichota bacterium]